MFQALYFSSWKYPWNLISLEFCLSRTLQVLSIQDKRGVSVDVSRQMGSLVLNDIWHFHSLKSLKITFINYILHIYNVLLYYFCLKRSKTCSKKQNSITTLPIDAVNLLVNVKFYYPSGMYSNIRSLKTLLSKLQLPKFPD